MKGNEHCIKECEKQGPCESCTQFKETPMYIHELNSKYKRPKYRPSSIIEKPHDSGWYK